MLISASELSDLLQSDAPVRVIDARSPRRYAAGHLPGAVNVPLSSIVALEGTAQALAGPGDFARVMGEAGIDRQGTVVVYGERGGVDAAYVYWAIEYYGHPDVRFLDGGIEVWTAKDFPVSTEPVEAGPAQFDPVPQERLRADAEEIAARLDELQLIDTRQLEEYTGELALTKRGGHIPGAIRFDWQSNVTSDTSFKPPSEVAAVLESAGIRPDRESVLYCLSGPRATHVYIAMKAAGFGPARVYERSWSEWGNRDDLPVAQGAGEE